MFAKNFVNNFFLQLRSLRVFVICLVLVEERSRNKFHLGVHLCRKCDISLIELSNLEPASAMCYQISRTIFYFDLRVPFRVFSHTTSLETFSKRKLF